MSGETPTAAAQLRSLVERIERVEVELSSFAEDRRSIYAEAKSAGFDVGALREVVKLRKRDRAEREAHSAQVETYLAALGESLHVD